MFTLSNSVWPSTSKSPSISTSSRFAVPSTSKSLTTFKLLLTVTSPSSASTVKKIVLSLALSKPIVLGLVLYTKFIESSSTVPLASLANCIKLGPPPLIFNIGFDPSDNKSILHETCKSLNTFTSQSSQSTLINYVA